MVRLITGEQECNNQSLTNFSHGRQDKAVPAPGPGVLTYCLHIVFKPL